MKRTSFGSARCPVARGLDVIGDWWSLMIVREAFAGARRFGEFQTSLGLAKNVLTDRLRKLVAAGVMETVPASDGSAYQEYVMTQKGQGLFQVLVALRQWSEANLYAADEPYMPLVDRLNRQPVQPMEVRSADGRVLHAIDTFIPRRLQAASAEGPGAAPVSTADLLHK